MTGSSGAGESIVARLSSALADRYRIERELGAGGMATVYLAQDLKHQRKVAVKVLRPELAAALGHERFVREITTTAALHHPHILALYDSGEAGGFLYYVMPFVEGESLRDRLDREKQLPLDDALQIAREVADALSYAHSRDVIHRDIKPENILLESGHAVVADFGIARAISAAGGERLTETGLAIGTPTYMSPEQAAASAELDGRSDLYSLGSVVYEMIAGQPPFTGPTVESVVHQHLTAEPRPITQLRPAVPAKIAEVLRRTLAKNPADRFTRVAQFADALTGARSGPPPTPAPGSRRVVVAIVAVLAVSVGFVLASRLHRGEDTVLVGRTTQVTRDPGLEVDPALSPDGSMVAYAAGPPSRMQIFVRQVSGGRVIALTSDSVQNHRWPRWSPDGSRIAYETEQGIAVVPALGGQSQPVIRADSTSGAASTTAFARFGGFAWSPDGSRIAYTSATAAAGLLITAVDGGEPTEITASIPGDSVEWGGLHSPAWSRDGSRLAVVSNNPIFVFGDVFLGNEGASSIWIIPLDGSAPIRVTDDTHLDMSPQWGPEGRHLYWVSDRGGGRDVYRARVGRDGRLAGEPVRVTTGADAHTITLSPDGSRLAYASFRTHSNIWALPVPRSGAITGEAARPVTSGAQTIETLDITPDGEWLAFDSDRSGNAEIYVMPAVGGEPLQLTNEPTGDYGPAWSPDGRRIAFHSLRFGTRDIFTMARDGSDLTRHTEGPLHQLAADWSPDGTALVFEDVSSDFSRGRLAILPLDGGELRPIEVAGDLERWSPTGDLIAFHSADGLHVISPRGGENRLIVPVTEEYGEPLYVAWAPDGRRLYYLAKGTHGSSIHVVTPADGRSRLVATFDDPARQPTRYGFATDGRTFYLTMGSHESDVWVADLERRP